MVKLMWGGDVIDSDDLEDLIYNNMNDDGRMDEEIDEIFGDVEVAGYTYRTSEVLREVDPTVYRQIALDLIDAWVSDAMHEIDRADPGDTVNIPILDGVEILCDNFESNNRKPKATSGRKPSKKKPIIKRTINKNSKATKPRTCGKKKPTTKRRS